MGIYKIKEYLTWKNVNDIPDDDEFILLDHLGGFDFDFKNKIFDMLQDKYDSITVVYHNILDDRVHSNYPDIRFRFSSRLQEELNFNYYDISTTLSKSSFDLKNFACSFNGTKHTSKALLTSALHKFGWFNSFSTKNFITNVDEIDGTVAQLAGNKENFFRKFIVTDDEKFHNTISTKMFTRYQHRHNIKILEPYIKESFIHIVSETMATSYQPFVTEKVLYSILIKGFWLSYAAPRYHQHLESYYGFKKFSIFDYDFDLIENPIIRLVELLSSIAKFEKLSKYEWHDLYSMEKETLEFNFDHYISKDYLKKLRNYD